MSKQKPVQHRPRSYRIDKRPARSLWKKLLWLFFWLTLLGSLAVCAAAVSFYFHLSEDLPEIASLADYRPPIISRIYADDGSKIAEFYTERRVVVPMNEIPDVLQKAFIAAEDARFYQHQGVDVLSIVRAFLKNMAAGEIVQGGSTITQQVAKSFFLTPQRKYIRKLKEAILAYRIERRFSKEEIFFLYLNQIYLGNGAYGVAAAAENYYGKKVQDLNLAESAILAGLPQAPSRYSPFRFPEKAIQRQIYVLNRMREKGFISEEEYRSARKNQPVIKEKHNWFREQAPYYAEYVRRYVTETYGEETLLTQGLQIHTAVSPRLQQLAVDALEKGLRELDKRQGYRGPLKSISTKEIEAYCQAAAAKAEPFEKDAIREGVVAAVNNKTGRVKVRAGKEWGQIKVSNMGWAAKPDPKRRYRPDRIKRPGDVLKTGDVILVRKLAPPTAKNNQMAVYGLEQTPLVQGALIAIETASGRVKAMVGGRDFKASQFNRAVQSLRQPGSAFKPLIYAAALDKGYTPATVILDSPIIYHDPHQNKTWKPRNYEKRFHGPTLMRKALAKSLNLVTIRILRDIGIDYAIDYVRKFGIEAKIDENLSIALGSAGLSLLELTNAYAVFDNMGKYQPPAFVLRIEDRDGKVLESHAPKPAQVIPPATAYLITSMLGSVVSEGTGRRVKALERPVAGKTGTTNDLRDAWFLGYTPGLVTGVWVGFDEEAPLGRNETGSRAASPIWLYFMQQALADTPVEGFEVPDDIVFARIDAATGLLPGAQSRNTLYECFARGTVPARQTPVPTSITTTEDLFKREDF